jgi:glycosyltransferase involved in cell wall biosynthesis
MMDLLATVPYYTAYLSRALLAEGVDLTIGSITYYLDPTCFSSRGLKLRPGLLDVVGRYPLPKLPRRILKLLEGTINLLALAIRFLFAPPDIIHVQFLPLLRSALPMDLWLVNLCQARGSKLVLTVHDLLPHDTGRAHRKMFQRLYSRTNAIICHSAHIANLLQSDFNVPAVKINIIPHGPFFYDLPDTTLASTTEEPDAVAVLWQGIIFPYKGVDLLLAAWATVEAAHPDAMLTIAGTGSPEIQAAIRAQVAALSLTRVQLDFRFLSTEELVALYRRADIVVYPYRAITTSGALATGLALGKTVVASDLPVFRELLTDNENAILVNPTDSDQLAASLIRLAGDQALRQQLSAKVAAMSFGDESWRAIARDTVRVYENVTVVAPTM